MILATIKALSYGGGMRIYVVEFADGVIKVGRSANLRCRLEQLNSARGGIVRWHASPMVGKFYSDYGTEAALIRRCATRFQRIAVRAREWFVGADFSAVVALLEEEATITLNWDHRGRREARA